MTVISGRHRFRAVVEPVADPGAPDTRVRLRLEAKGLDARWIDLNGEAAKDLVRAVEDALRTA